MAEHDLPDLNNLLLPLGNKVGAVNRISALIAEMTHPNIDWKYVVGGLRSYLYDFLYDILPHHDKVFPVVYHYLKEATARRRNSALRASDTFFDRYIFVLKNFIEGDANFAGLKGDFDAAADDYLELLISESNQGYYFEAINDRVLAAGSLLVKDSHNHSAIVQRLNAFLLSQFKLHAKRSILAEDTDLAMLEKSIADGAETVDFLHLLRSVASSAQRNSVTAVESLNAEKPVEYFSRLASLVDFSHNSKTWERICLSAKSLIENGVINNNEAIIQLLSYLIKKSQEGEDRNLQLFISRTVASVCSALEGLGKGELLRTVVDMVMPVLQSEIERDGNYYAAFATIYNIGKTVIESGKTPVIDHFVDILVKSKFRFPEFSGIASDWSVIVNSSHLENIRTWMRLIELNPRIMRKLAASLIVNLKLGGVFLKDTDVFQRDVSRLLNSDYADVFHLITSLAAVFPAFYHDIGATGNIRAFTEKIDTNHLMNDLVHFLRKQVHVESSSRTVLLLQRVMEFWKTGEKELLKNLVPAEVYDNLDRSHRLVNLDGEPAAQAVFEEAKRLFPEYSELRFWDFFQAVGKKRFEEVAGSLRGEGIAPELVRDAIGCLSEYLEAQFPAEMTKMLHHIRSMFDIDTSKKQIWKFLYEVSDEDFRKIFENVRFLDVSRVNVEKFITFLHVYRMIFDKYNFSDVRDIEKLEAYAAENLFDPPEDFFQKLKGSDLYVALDALLGLQNSLKRDILLSRKEYEPIDTIEFKRHIAFGIPSMYGSYKERKFDTLKVFFHSNLIRERLFESLLESSAIFPHERINYDELKRITALFHRAFEIDGFANHEMRSMISLLEVPNLAITQFRDIVTSLLTIHGEISDLFNETYKYVCSVIIDNIGVKRIVEDYLPHETNRNAEVIVDRFLRSQIMQSPLLQLFDNLLIRVRDRIASDLEARGDLVCLNASDTRKNKGPLFHVIGRHPETAGREELFVPLWQTGSKAQGLIIAANMEGLHVPEGIVVSTEFYKRIREGDADNPRFQRKVIYSLKKYIDEFTGGRYANPRDPVLLSVRSGAVFSMPGVMDTITNVGVTQEIIDRLAERDPWFAYDCYRRLIHDFGISIYGIDRSLFEQLMAQAKEEAGVDLKEKLVGGQMEVLTKKYRFAINKLGFSVPKDPYEQLFFAVHGVFKSWDSEIAQNYRRLVNISDDWGTAVIIQRMVFGNVSPLCITGVVHSHYLGYENIGLFGEYKTRAQGHDIVSGIARVFPISEGQRIKYARSGVFPSLEKTYPEHYKKIYHAVKLIRERWGNDVEIEFTMENDVLYILQIRGMVTHIFETEELVESPAELSEYLLGQGLAASGGAVSGRAVFDIDRIELLRIRYPGDKLILIRPETNPEDVIGIQKSDGILTCIGGMTSHAVLQMRRMAKSGVSDFSLMKIDEQGNMAVVRREPSEKGKVIIREGDFLTIDGHTGHVYLGYHRTVKKGL